MGQEVTPFVGSRSYYLRDGAAQLEQALVRYAVERLTKEFGFTAVSVPDVLHRRVVERCGMDPDESSSVYALDPADHGPMVLSGTAEMALGGMLVNKVLDVEERPKKYGGE